MPLSLPQMKKEPFSETFKWRRFEVWGCRWMYRLGRNSTNRVGAIGLIDPYKKTRSSPRRGGYSPGFCSQVLFLQGMVLTVVLCSGGFIHSRRRSYYLFFNYLSSTCMVFPKQRRIGGGIFPKQRRIGSASLPETAWKTPSIYRSLWKNIVTGNSRSGFQRPEALHLRVNARSRQRRALLPNLLAEDDPKVEWRAGRGEESGRPEPSSSSTPARPA